MKKERYIVLCILVVLFILAIIVLFEKYVISANLQEGATNNSSYIDTRSYCNGGKIYVHGAAKVISVTDNDEETCANMCQDNENCDVYLMSDPNTCWTYKDVSDISLYCEPGNNPDHNYWGKVKSNMENNIVRYPSTENSPYFDTSSYCDGDNIYVNAISTPINKTQEDEESCKQKCVDNENCDMYLMQEKDGKNICWTYKDVSDISMYCKPGYDPPHTYWGKVKSNMESNIVRYPESAAELEAQQEAKEKAQQEAREKAQQEAREKAQQEEALAKEESEEEAKLTSEEAKFTSEEAKLTSEEAKFTSEKAKLTSEEAKADSLQEKLALYSKTISNLRGQLATCGKKPVLLMDDKPSLKPCKSTTKTHIIPQADDLINIHYSNTNIKI